MGITDTLLPMYSLLLHNLTRGITPTGDCPKCEKIEVGMESEQELWFIRDIYIIN